MRYKVVAQDRKRDLLPIERDLWNVLEPFLERVSCALRSVSFDADALKHMLGSLSRPCHEHAVLHA